MSDFSVSEAGVKGINKFGHSVTIPWNELRGLRKELFSQKHWIAGYENSILVPPRSEDFLRQFFRAWREYDPHAAKKNAFDYVDSRQPFGRILVVVSVLFCLGVGIITSIDAREQAACTEALVGTTEQTEAQLTNMRRKRKGHYLVELSYTTKSGQTLKGKEQIITAEEEIPNQKMPIIYSPEIPQCWAFINKDSDVNWAKRRFFATWIFWFSAFFLASGVSGLAIGVAMVREKRIYADQIAEQFQIS